MVSSVRTRWLNYWHRQFEAAQHKPSPGAFSQQQGLLLIALCLFCLNIGMWMGRGRHADSSGDHLNLIVAVMLVLNVLAFQFRWPLVMLIALRVAALAWIVFAYVMLFR